MESLIIPKYFTSTSQGVTFKSFFFKIYLLIMLLQLSHSPPLHSILPTPSLPHSPYSSCLWVTHISSLASAFPILFLPSPCLFSTYHLCYLYSVSFPLLSPSHSPVNNPPCDLHFCGSVPILVVCLVCFFVVVLGVVVNNCEFAVIFTIHIFYLLFLRSIPLTFHIIRPW